MSLFLEEKFQARKVLLRNLLTGGSGDALLTRLPAPVTDIIADYAQVPFWGLATTYPGVFGDIEIVSAHGIICFLHSAPYLEGQVQGDTPLSAGLHAWRVKAGGLGLGVALGVVWWQPEKEGAPPLDWPLDDPALYGVVCVGQGACTRLTAGEQSKDSGLWDIYPGHTADLLLDCDKGSLTVITLRDGRRCTVALPLNTAWLPYFWISCRGGGPFFVDLLEPEQAGIVDEAC